MKKVIVAMSCALVLTAAPLAAQTGSGSGSGSGSGRGDQAKAQEKAAEAVAVTTKIAEAQAKPVSRWVTALTNVQIELTLTDQLGPAAPEKKTVSMIVASGNWGKIRSVGTVRPAGEPPFGVDLNVDARPLVSVDGLIQLELTLNYSPPADKESARPRPTGINQSQTVVLQSGKPLSISQAADPLNDRKVMVEVKATVLK